jgi:hypothetical protein
MSNAQIMFITVGAAFWSCLMIIAGRLIEQHYQKDSKP